MLGIAKPHLWEQSFKRVVRGLPINPGSLHGDGCNSGIAEKLRQGLKALFRRGKALFCYLHAAVGLYYPGAGHYGVAMDVKSGYLVSNLFHFSPPFG